MATGYTTNGTCYATPQEAIDAHFQTIKPFDLLTATGNSVFIEPIKLGTGVWQWKKWTITNTCLLYTSRCV